VKALLVLAALAPLACQVGEGSGDVFGPLFIENCKGEVRAGSVRTPFGMSPTAPAVYHLNPGFFAAEPIQDIATGVKANRLIIRLQTTGRRREANDIVRFDIPDSREVARCVRGRIDPATAQPDYDPKECFWGPNGPRVRIGPEALVRSYFTPNFTCNAPVVGTAVSTTPTAANGGMWESWIEFEHFGTAEQANVAAEQRSMVSDEFKVEFDQRLTARALHLRLQDDAYVRAVLDMNPPPLRPPLISGELEGQFDFDMQRGQGAQTFP
jgi:hypothetical protein